MKKNWRIFALFLAIFAILLNAEDLDSLESTPDSPESMLKSTQDSQDSLESTTDSLKTAEIQAQDSPESNSDLYESKKSEDPEFPDYDDDIDLLKSFLSRFSMHNENYFLPLYYSTKIFQSNDVKPYDKPYKRFEVKLQISAKVSIFKDLLETGIGSYFAYTQKSFFQMYSRSISSPFRSTDYNPEFIIYKGFDFGLLVRFGYRHLSNGDAGKDSRSMDMIALDLAYRISDFRATLKSWVYMTHDPSDIRKYLGHSDLILEYHFLERNHLRLTIGNLVHNYKHYKGNVKLEYRFDMRHFGIFVQYFYGYADSLHEYNMKKHAFGLGFAVATSKIK